MSEDMKCFYLVACIVGMFGLCLSTLAGFLCILLGITSHQWDGVALGLVLISLSFFGIRRIFKTGETTWKPQPQPKA